MARLPLSVVILAVVVVGVFVLIPTGLSPQDRDRVFMEVYGEEPELGDSLAAEAIEVEILKRNYAQASEAVVSAMRTYAWRQWALRLGAVCMALGCVVVLWRCQRSNCQTGSNNGSRTSSGMIRRS